MLAGHQAATGYPDLHRAGYRLALADLHRLEWSGPALADLHRLEWSGPALADLHRLAWSGPMLAGVKVINAKIGFIGSVKA